MQRVEDSSDQASQVVGIAQELLSKRFGGAPELSDIEVLSGSGNATVVRARVAPSAFLPYRSVVVKHMPETGNDLDDAAFLREVVAYQFTTSLPEGVRPGPVLLAYDMEGRIVVLTDIGASDTLVHTLGVADDKERVKLLRLLGEQLGQMHAGTASREEDYDVLLRRLLNKHPQFSDKHAARDEALRGSIPLGLDILRTAGLEAPTEFVELAEHATVIQQGGRARAFTPFDLSPDNIVVGDKIYFLDYEWAGFRNVGFDVASVIAGFPQFLFSKPLTDEEVDVFVGAWTREILSVWPRYAEDWKLHHLLVASLIGWALSSVSALYSGGLEGILSMHSGDVAVHAEGSAHLLRPGEAGPFTEDELLVRQDLFETFDALARYAARCGEPGCQPVSEFAARCAERLAEGGG